ncbi:MAG: NnrU family protein [Devosia sp.]
MIALILGLVLFFGMHAIRMLAPGLRDAQIAASEGRWKGLYSLVSLAGFVLIVWGYILYRPDAPQLYLPPDWGRYAAIVLVWLGFVCLVAAYQPVGRIKATIQHPMLTGIALWSAGHLLANGDGAGFIVFGAFLVYSLWNLAAQFRRDQPRPAFAGYRGDIVALVSGTIAYAAILLWLHAWLFGVNPMA